MSWMQSLSNHYHEMSKKYKDQQLMIVFDIDDTIVDIRLPLLFVLKKYDHLHNTSHFDHLQHEEDIEFEEWKIQNWLLSVVDDPEERERIVEFVRANMWKENTIFMSHRPFRGVLEIIRWFQIQDNIEVGLNTGRSEELRDITLNSLNTLGREYRVQFKDELLYMNPLENTEGKDVTSYKAKGIKYYQEMGYKVIAFIDNEPANLKAVDKQIDDPDLRLLHADTTFGSSRRLRPESSIVGTDYRMEDVIDLDTGYETDFLPSHIQFIWNGVNTFDVLESYREENVYWAEVDARQHPLTGEIVLRHESFDAPEFEDRDLISLETMLSELIPLDRGIKIVLKNNDELLDKIISILKQFDIASSRLWFDIIFEVFDKQGLQRIQREFPKASIMTRVDFLVPLLSQFPSYVEDIINNLSEQGITDFSISINTYNKEIFLDKMDTWDYNVNIRDIYLFEDFLQAILMLPTSIISTFDF